MDPPATPLHARRAPGLEGRVAVVTGAASGIGRATAVALAAAGARVFAADVDVPRGERAAAEIREAGGAADFGRVDLADGDSIAACADEMLARTGAPHILVNAAGWDEIRPFVETSPELVDRLVGVNLVGPVKLTRALLPAMIEAGRGKIVNVASDAGRVGSSGETVYAGAKGGIIAFTKSVAREVARHGITSNCVCPGPTDTPLFQSLPEKLKAALVRAIPFGRLARPEEVADAILFFASPSSDYVTGQVLSVSGGLTMAG